MVKKAGKSYCTERFQFWAQPTRKVRSTAKCVQRGGRCRVASANNQRRRRSRTPGDADARFTAAMTIELMYEEDDRAQPRYHPRMITTVL